MSGVEAQIKIFPNSEMLAADMAEVLHAALPESCVIQGCHLVLDNGTLSITDGRIVIKGRLAQITAGTIETPSVATTGVDGYVCAVCDLGSGANPFSIQILLQTQYDTILDSQQGAISATEGDTFNSNNGVALLLLATVKISPTGITSMTPSAKGGSPRHAVDYIDEKDTALSNRITGTGNTITYNKNVADAKATYLAKKSWSNLKFKIYNVTIPHFVVNAGATVKQSAPSTYGVVNTWGNGAIQSQFYDWYGGVKSAFPTKHNYDYTPSGANPRYSDNKVDEYGLRLNIHEFDIYGVVTLRPIGIVAAAISNAKVGGKNYAGCYFTQWSYSTDMCEATVHNSGKEQAIVDVTLRILYAQAE